MWQVGGACYSTEVLAVGAVAAAESGSVKATPAGLYSLDVASFDASSIEWTLTPLDGGPTLANVVVPVTPIPCGLLTHVDAVDVGWKIALCWCAVFAIKFLARPLVDRWSPDYGNT